MRTSWGHKGATLQFQIRLDPEDPINTIGQYGLAIHLVTDSAQISLPTAIEEPHPDLLGLAALVLTRPWIARRITFDRPISRRLAEAVFEHTGIAAGPVDDSLTPRKPGPIAGLSFSGGADSIAVSTLLDPDIPYIHFRRVKHPRVPDRATHYRADVTQAIVERMADRGVNAAIVKSNSEFMVGPFPMYPVWQAVTLGSVLLADCCQLGAIATGTTLGARYMPQERGFDSSNEPEFWNDAFAAAGIPLLLPAHGMTEILSYRLAQDSVLKDLARSCALGTVDSPCLSCVKCIRKELIAAAAESRPVSQALLHRIKERPEGLARFLEGPPYYVQHTVEYALARIPGIEATPFGEIVKILHPTVEGTAWVGKYYGPALTTEIPDPWRDPIKQVILKRCELMSPAEEESIRTYDPLASVAKG